MNDNLFQETQTTRKVILLILSAPLVLFGYAIYQQLFLKIPFGDKPASDTSLIFITILYTLFLFFIVNIKLQTIIRKDGITLSYSPFFKNKFYSFETIESITIEKYSPFRKYLGHGIRVNFDGSSSYSINGNYAFFLKFKNGSKLKIGTQQPDKAKSALRNANI